MGRRGVEIDSQQVWDFLLKGDKNSLKLECGNGCTTLQITLKTLNCILK